MAAKDKVGYREWSREVPPEWEALLRSISPVSTVVPWLSIWWHPHVRESEPGKGDWHDGGRWLLHECVPFDMLDDREKLSLLPMFLGPPACRLSPGAAYARRLRVNDYQYQMFRSHRVYARQLWIIQGTQGGHPTVYQEPERKLLKLRNLPTDPPALGELPYAPLDNRVIRQMLHRNRLIQFGNDLHAWRMSGTHAAYDRDWAEEQRQYRIAYLDWLCTTVEPEVEFWQANSWKKEIREVIPAASREAMNAASQFKDLFIDTGVVPHAPMVAG